MHKDFKTGMAIGLVFVAGVGAWFVTRPSLRTENLRDRIADSQSAPPEEPSPPVNPERSVSPPVDPQPATPRPADPPGRTVKPTPRTTTRTHVVKTDETLSQIAERYYGSSAQWRQIFEANRNVISNPDKVKPGTSLVIP